MKNNIELHYKDKKYIVGLDEAGRGAWAGPITVAAVILPQGFSDDILNDSKKMTRIAREKYFTIIKEQAVDWVIVDMSVEEVEKLGPKKASILGMQICLKQLKQKPDFVITDFEKIESDIEQLNLVKGDSLSNSVAAASVLAKVRRDSLMEMYDHKYSGYGFKNNVGYGTKKHSEALKTLGVTSIHRKTYKPIQKLLLEK
ncbi:ribonuclease HII [Mycoplasma sp. Ms02]|uniref:ribonuclease HII n=1 Tax=Mycoplasma sp. Ms02 TaxID=353851 RepID=UPI001C8AA9A5|nr:ribonuclease HII [Mycoplasma sp. Ms02]QZE12367.1 ribonuclease HII [Mycoplasma sp. Ms02]